jgi:hypothetical protein
MKCPVHSDRDVVGYCTDCGAFGCDRCLSPKASGDSLCQKCEKARGAAVKTGKKGLVSKLLGDKKTPTPAAARRSPPGRASVARKAGTSRKLVISFRNKKIVKGMTYKLDPHSLGFYLVPLEPQGDEERMYVHFSDLKAIYFVRDFEGKFDSSEAVQDYPAEGQEARVAFEDGEIIEGRTLHHFDPACLRFFLAPKENRGNNISVLVERSALKGLEIGDYKEGFFAEEEEVLNVTATGKKGRAPLSQNESMGDLYFSMKNYDAALSEYEKVRQEYAHDKRLGLKISVCNFNRGVNFIKSRRYLEAKAEFEKIGEDDPIYEKAKKKIRKIEKILKEVESMGT